MNDLRRYNEYDRYMSEASNARAEAEERWLKEHPTQRFIYKARQINAEMQLMLDRVFNRIPF